MLPDITWSLTAKTKSLINHASKHTSWVVRILFLNERASTNEYEVRKSLTDFFENLYELAENCQFCSLTEELMHDSIVVGIRLDSFSQKLMQDDRFKPDKAITETKLSELVKEHHEILKANENRKLEGKINRVHSMEKSRPKPRNMKENEQSKVQKPHRKFPAKTCYLCGKSPLHKREEYQATRL